MPSDTPTIQRSTLSYLGDLAKHNDRDWFEAHKARYQAARGNMQDFADALIVHMNRHDRISTENGKRSIFRIYTDQRFHKDRPPYKTWLAGYLERVKPALRGGYYFHIEPGNSFLGCGFYGPEKEDLQRIRMDILYEHATWAKLLRAAPLRTIWGSMEGNQLKTAPRNFPKAHAAIGLLRHTQFIFRRNFSDKEVLAGGFVEEVDRSFKAMRPWLNHLSEVLTTDGNGDPLG
ncbi:MAG: DUF2461 domain-containing protein [Flavobacteriales bacterium]|nr:DUF2461 domain-containing protein [Flavobacteriales bacterium]